ncbi:MAG: metallophosphoesterase [Chloroflexi bacterium]|nr:metallophosphoesterase [Chloroflexota bacterium]
MKIAILSDNHGNVPALQTVIEHIEAWQPDHVIFNGDAVNRGPKSLESWQIVQAKRQQNGWLMARGNHEDYVLNHEKEDPHAIPVDYKTQINQNSRWTHRQLNGRSPGISRPPPQPHPHSARWQQIVRHPRFCARQYRWHLSPPR